MKEARSLVVALGNPLQGDDGFGSAVLERLRRDPAISTVADLHEAHTDLLGCLDRFRGYRLVVLVDAVMGAGPAGSVGLLDEERLRACDTRSSSCHQLSPLDAVRLFRTLSPESHTRIQLVALHVESLGRKRGPYFAQAVEEGVESVRRLLGRAGSSRSAAGS